MSNVVAITPSTFTATTYTSAPPLSPLSSPSPFSTTSPSPPPPDSTSSRPTKPLPIAAIAGAIAGVLIIMVATAIWMFIRKRRQQTSKTSPSISPKGRDLEQQLVLHLDKNDDPFRKSHHTPRSSTQTARRIENPYHVQPSSVTSDSIPPRTSSSAHSYYSSHNITSTPNNKTPSVHSLASNDTRQKSEKKKHRRQASSQSISRPSTVDLPPPPPTPSHPFTTTVSTKATTNVPSAESRRKSVVALAVENQPTDCHIDMLDVDVETLMPIIVSDEIQPVVTLGLSPVVRPRPSSPPQQQGQQPKNKEQDNVTTNKPNSSSNSSSSNNNSANSSPALNPIISSFPIMPTPTPRRPPLISRKSTDGYISTRLSMSHLPPPPPPSVPPPAIPSTYPGDHNEGRSTTPGRMSSEASSTRSSIYATCPNTRGRRPRASTESTSTNARRSISLDSTSYYWDEQQLPDLPARTKANNSPSRGSAGSRTSKRIIMPPSTPPPAAPTHAAPSAAAAGTPALSFSKPQAPGSQVPVPVHARRKNGHQKSPSQIMSTGFFVSPERSPLSPLSPPLSPLTIQIPRNSPSNSTRASFVGTTGQPFPHYTASNVLNMNRPDSPTAGSNHSSPTPTTTSFAKTHAKSKKSRSKSISQAEAHRIMVPSPNMANSIGVGPMSPPMPSYTRSTLTPSLPVILPVSGRSSDHPPPSPATLSHLMHLRRPSLTQYQQQQQLMASSWDASNSRSLTATPTAMASSMKSDGDHEDQDRDPRQQRRSVSLDSWIQQRRSSPTSPTSPTGPSSQIGGHPLMDDAEAAERYSIISADRDLDVQTIISDALAIAIAKSAAMDAARQSAWQRPSQRFQGQSSYVQLLQQGSTSRPWTPSEDAWGASTGPTTSRSSSRSESPFYSPYTTMTAAAASASSSATVSRATRTPSPSY